MRVYELMEQLSELKAGAEVKISMCIRADMDLFEEDNEPTVYAGVTDVSMESGNVHLGTGAVEI